MSSACEILVEKLRFDWAYDSTDGGYWLIFGESPAARRKANATERRLLKLVLDAHGLPSSGSLCHS